MKRKLSNLINLIIPEYKKIGLLKSLNLRIIQSFSFLVCFRILSNKNITNKEIIIMIRENRLYLGNIHNNHCNTSSEIDNIYKIIKKKNRKIIKISDPLSLSFYKLKLHENTLKKLLIIILNLPINLILLLFFQKFINLFYYYLLEKTKAKYVLEIMPNISLCKACKKRDIKIMDIQHGAISLDHEWYLFRASQNPISNLKKYSPTHYFVWDRESKESLIKIGNKANKIIITNIPKPNLNKSISKELRELKQCFKSKLVLVTLQYGKWYGKNRNNVLPSEVVNALINVESTLIVFKIHPMILKRERIEQAKNILSLRRHLNKSSKIIISSNESLEQLIQISNLHITINSSSCIMASKYGIRTLIVDTNLDKDQAKFYKRYKGIILCGHNKKDELIKLINTQCKYPKKQLENKISMANKISNYLVNSLKKNKYNKFLNS